MARRTSQFLIAVAIFLLPSAAFVAPARADNASSLLAMVNSLRASHRVGPLYADPTLSAVAQAWSVHMAASGLSHNPNLASQVGGGWTKLGENVGAAGNIPAVFNAFVNSPFHFGNLIDPTYNLTGIGVAPGPNGTLWVTQDFEGKPGATPATTKPPTTAPTAAPTTRPATPQTTVTTHPPTTPPTAPSTAPPTTATTSPAPSTTVPPALGLDTTTAPAESTTSAPPRLAAGAALTGTRRRGPGGGLALALAGAGIATVAGAALFVMKGFRA